MVMMGREEKRRNTWCVVVEPTNQLTNGTRREKVGVFVNVVVVDDEGGTSEKGKQYDYRYLPSVTLRLGDNLERASRVEVVRKIRIRTVEGRAGRRTLPSKCRGGGWRFSVCH